MKCNFKCLCYHATLSCFTLQHIIKSKPINCNLHICLVSSNLNVNLLSVENDFLVLYFINLIGLNVWRCTLVIFIKECFCYFVKPILNNDWFLRKNVFWAGFGISLRLKAPDMHDFDENTLRLPREFWGMSLWRQKLTSPLLILFSRILSLTGNTALTHTSVPLLHFPDVTF